MENKSTTECAHKWVVILSVKFLPWEAFVRIRSQEEMDNKALEQTVTHTLFCSECQRIKRVD